VQIFCPPLGAIFPVVRAQDVVQADEVDIPRIGDGPAARGAGRVGAPILAPGIGPDAAEQLSLRASKHPALVDEGLGRLDANLKLPDLLAGLQVERKDAAVGCRDVGAIAGNRRPLFHDAGVVAAPHFAAVGDAVAGDRFARRDQQPVAADERRRGQRAWLNAPDWLAGRHVERQQLTLAHDDEAFV